MPRGEDGGELVALDAELGRGDDGGPVALVPRRFSSNGGTRSQAALRVTVDLLIPSRKRL